MRKFWPKATKKTTLATDASTPVPTAPKDLFRSRGDDRVQSGDYNAAVVMYTEALRDAPTDGTLLTSRSLAYMMSTPPRLDLALRDADAAIQQDPTNGQAWSQKGETLLREGNLREAEEALLNAAGFAKGLEKLPAQRALADVRARRAQISPAPAASSASIPSTAPIPSAELSLPTAPLPQTPYVAQTSSTTVSTTSIPSPAPTTPTSAQPTTVGQTPAVAEPLRPPAQSSPPAPSPVLSRPTTPPSYTPSATQTTSPTAIPSPALTSPASAQPTTPGRIPSAASPSHTSVPTTPLPRTPSVTRASPSSPLTTPARTQPTALGRTPSTAEPSRTFAQSQPSAPSPAPSLPTAPLSQPPPAARTSYATTPATPISGSAPTTPPTARPLGGTPRNTANQPERVPPVIRTNNSTSVSDAPASSLPLTPEDLIGLTSEAPPGYTPDIDNPDPTVRALSEQALATQLTHLQTALAAKNKGSVSIRPYTTAGAIDAVKLVYVGLTQLQLTARELGTPTYLHSSFYTMAVDMFQYPGNTFLDMDCESSKYYEGKLPGTVSISGYSEEYREHQLLKSPLLNLALERTDTLPTRTIDKVVDRIRLLQRQPTFEDSVALREILGLSQLTALQTGWQSGGGRQRQIEAICMALNRSLYEAPTRFVDFSKARNISNNTLGGPTRGIGLGNFLFQILLGAELLLRLRKEPITTSYAGLMTDAISALIILSALWMHNVVIQGPSATATTAFLATTTTILPTSKYVLVAKHHQLQAEGLIRFGEELSWPYMDEARNYIENAYQDLISNRGVVGFDMCDWLFGLVLPGKIFRHRIMCCLVYASPSIRSFNAAPFWDNGLVVKNKSYWPKRSVLGRVLGGLRNPRSVCGWVGPVPAPEGSFSGWIRLNARRVDIPVPVSTTQTSLQSLGFGEPDGTESAEATLQSLTDPNEWIQACPPQRLTTDSRNSVFKGIHLVEIPSPTATTTMAGTNSTSKEYRASLEFNVNGTLIRYTLYSNPLFVYAPPCVGTHTMHRRQAETYLNNVIKVADLKEAYPPSDSLVIVDALGQGEEVVARAWCAERARHAVVRRDGECCFACAVAVTVGRTGLGFNVLIWSR